MESNFNEFQDRHNRRIIECVASTYPTWKKRYLLETGTPGERQVAADQIRYKLAPFLIAGGITCALLGTIQFRESWSQALWSLSMLLLAMFAGYELKRFHDLRPAAKERIRLLDGINVSNMMPR